MTRSDSQPLQTRDLVALFQSEAAAAFEPWVRGQGGSWHYGLGHAEGGRVVPTTPDHLRGFFFAAGRFETPALTGEITFGDRELEINMLVGPRSRGVEQHGLWEWADAFGRSDLVPRNTSFVLQADRLRTIVHQMAVALRELALPIGQAGPEVIQIIEAARAIAQSSFDSRLRREEHASRVSLANEAFVAKNWNRVVELLEAVEDRLTSAERAKLRYARDHRS